MSKKDSIEIDVKWGGYYTYKYAGTYGVFRLLDIDKYEYHASSFQEKFDHKPTIDEVSKLSPYIFHAPIDLGGLLEFEDLHLIGYRELTKDDLRGYLRYMQGARRIKPEIIKKQPPVYRRLSKGPIQKARISKSDGMTTLTFLN
jgi:hypothetical protein